MAENTNHLEELDCGELLRVVNNRIFQDVIEGGLSRTNVWGPDWAKKLYDLAQHEVSAGTPEERAKHEPFVDKVDEAGGRNTASKFMIDTTYGFYLVRYYNSTKHYFHWGPPDMFKRVKDARNLQSHDSEESASKKFEQYFIIYNRLEPLVDEVADALPGHYNRESLRASWREALEAAKKALYQRVGSLADASAMNRLAKERMAFGTELSRNTLVWLNSKILRRYENLFFDESVELLREACRMYGSFAELPWDLDQCAQGEFEHLSQNFRDTSLRRWLEEIGAPGARSQKSILELLKEDWFPESEDKSYQKLREAAVEAARKRGTRPAGQVEANAMDALVVLMAVAFRYRNEIRAERTRLLREEALDENRYAREIVENYRRESLEALPFVPLRWRIQSAAQSELTPGEEILTRAGLPQIRLFGEAGSGNSTLLKRLVYLQAQKVLAGESGKIPVYIELQRLQASSRPLEDAVAGALGITADEAGLFLEAEDLILYLDGFNEMLEYTVKAQFASAINRFLNAHPGQEVILTDRTPKLSLRILSSAVQVFFYPLDMDDIRSFLRVACRREETREQLLALCDEKEAQIRTFDSPMRLEQLIREFEETGTITSDTVENYVRFLLEREASRKMDRNVEYVETFLQVLAVLTLMDKEARDHEETTIFRLSSQEEEETVLFTEAQAEEIFGYLAQRRFWTIPDSRACVQLCVDLGLLASYEEEGRNYLGFAKSDYEAAFYFGAMDQGNDRRVRGIYRWMSEDI
ncbi:MAG: hypothetical protein IJU99_01505 [Lachnospiraceae bacterium]|nr:hypothetical protein [Lachnospiraceae bacterium]